MNEQRAEIISKLNENEYYKYDRKLLNISFYVGIVGFALMGMLFIKDWTFIGIICFIAAIFVAVLKARKGTEPEWIFITNIIDVKKITGEKKKFFRQKEYIEATEDDKRFIYVYFVKYQGKVIPALTPQKFYSEQLSVGDRIIVWESLFKAKCLPVSLLINENDKEEELSEED